MEGIERMLDRARLGLLPPSLHVCIPFMEQSFALLT
jgi:hypothetical protein